MDQIHKYAFEQAFHKFYEGNQDAIDLSMMLVNVCNIWDDLIDGDEVTENDINLIFRYLIFDIPMNKIYNSIPGINAHLLNVYLRWRDATAMESMPSPDIEKTYMLRAGIYDIFSIIVYHLLGDEKLKEIGPQIRFLYGETMSDLRGEFCHA